MYLRSKKVTSYTNGRKNKIKTNTQIAPPTNFDETELPHITLYYYPHKQNDTTEIIIPLYFTDFYQKDYKFNDFSDKFTVRYEVDGVVKVIENVPPGDFNLNLGILSEGMHYYSVQIRDKFGRESRRIFNDLWIINEEKYRIKDNEIYTMKTNDLSLYSINNQNSKVLEDMISNRVGLTKLFNDKQLEGYRKIVLLNGTYRVNRTTRMGTGRDTCISIPTNFTVDMNNSTFKMHEYSDSEYGDIARTENLMIKMQGCTDSHLTNGTLEGDYFERKENGWISGSNGEHNNTFYSYGGSFCSLSNLNINQTTGYNICCGQNGSLGNGRLGSFVDNVAIVNGTEISKNGYTTSTIGTMDNKMLENKYIVASIWLAMGGLKGLYWDMDFHFYDNNEVFIETIKVYQFTRCRIPNNATKFRVTFRAKSSDIGSLSIHHMDVCRYFEINNCHWIDNRTCAAPFQSQHYTYNNCTFTRSGQSITPCEIDFEDGWEQQQDFYIRGCEIFENTGTGDVIDNSGINHIMEDCKNFSLIARHRINGVVYKNNVGGFSMTTGWMTGNTVRVYGNRLTSLAMGQTELEFFNYKKTKLHINNNFIDSCYIDRGKEFYTISKSKIIDGHTTANYNIEDSIIQRKGNAAYINGNIDVKNSIYKLYDGETISKFSFNAANVKRKYLNCIYEAPCHFANHNYFNSGNWINCTFKETLLLQPKTETKCNSQIQFNNCVFEKEITIDLGNLSYAQFNKCEFKGGIKYIGTSEQRSVFNDFIPTEVEYIKINPPLLYMEMKQKYKFTAELLPYTATNLIPNWSTNNEDILTIDDEGYSTGHSVGEVNIIATANSGLEDVYSVRIVDNDIYYGGAIDSNGNYTTSSFCYTNNKYEEVISGKQLKVQYGNNIGVTYGFIAQYDENKKFIKSIGRLSPSNNSFGTLLSNNAKYVRIGFWRQSSETKIPELFSTYSLNYL